MRLLRLLGSGFRNLEDFDLALDPSFTVLHGANAQGKTNTLEAIWFLCSLKPLRARRVKDLVQWGQPGATLAGDSSHQDIDLRRKVTLEGNERLLFLDGKRCNQLPEYFEGLRAIAFQPSDVAIVKDSPEHRRRWIDRAAFTARPAHLDLVRSYAKVLANKGAALRGQRPDPVLLDSLDEQLVAYGAELAFRRAELIQELGGFVEQMVGALAGSSARVGVRLQTVAEGGTLAERRASLLQAVRRARPGELQRRRTLTGVQMDEVVLELAGRSAREYASQGQVRTLVLALKLAELVAGRERGVVPLFLLDDLSSELDHSRTGRLIGLLGDLGAQVVATTTDPEHLARATGRRPLELRVEAGRICA